MQIPFIAWVLQGIPECIAVATFVISLSTNTLPWGKILKIGLLEAIVSYLIRFLPFTPGIHTLILITSLAAFSVWIGSIEIRKAITFSVIVVSLLIVFEFIFFSLLKHLNIFMLEQSGNSTMLRVLVTYPQVVFIFLLAVALKNKKSFLAI